MFPPKKGMLAFSLLQVRRLPSGFLSSFPSSSAESCA